MATTEQPTKVHHLGFEVPSDLMGWEKAFWQAIGFDRITRPEPKPNGEWLNGGGVFVHLTNIGGAGLRLDMDDNRWNHAAIVPRHGLDHAMERLEALPFRIRAEHAEDYWGARRVFMYSPAGHRVELLEREPPAVWPGAPLDD